MSLSYLKSFSGFLPCLSQRQNLSLGRVGPWSGSVAPLTLNHYSNWPSYWHRNVARFFQPRGLCTLSSSPRISFLHIWPCNFYSPFRTFIHLGSLHRPHSRPMNPTAHVLIIASRLCLRSGLYAWHPTQCLAYCRHPVSMYRWMSKWMIKYFMSKTRALKLKSTCLEPRTFLSPLPLHAPGTDTWALGLRWIIRMYVTYDSKFHPHDEQCYK